MTREGVYGVFIYTLIPISFILVLGGALRSADPKTIFVNFASRVFSTGGNALDWLVALMLIVALVLSALNAITGTARALHQMSVDGQFPRRTGDRVRSEEHTSELQSPDHLVCRLLLEKKK